jgi:hypothetical protein
VGEGRTAIGDNDPCSESDDFRWRPFGVVALLGLAAAGWLVQGLAGAGFERNPRIHAARAKADASISEATPRRNYGQARQLIVDGSPVVRTYVRFDADLRSEDISHVSLLLFNLRRRSQTGYKVQPVYGRWSERKITFANAPELAPPYVVSGPLAARSWKVVDITSIVVGEKGVSLALTTTSPNAVMFASRETRKRGPRLVIEQEPQETTTRSTTTTTETSPQPPPG